MFAFEVKLFVPFNVKTAELPLDMIGHEQNEILEEVTLVVDAPFTERPFPEEFDSVDVARSKLPPSILTSSLLEFERELPYTDAVPL